MEDLTQLQSRVEAARERLGGAEADQRKYGLRLDDLVRIVEGALTRQSAELAAVRIRASSLETELDDARNALSRNEVDLAARDTDLVRLNLQNEQLRTMVMTLLDLVEGRNTTPMREALIRLERGVRHLLTETTASVAKPEAPRAATPPREPERPATAARPVLVPNPSVQGRVIPVKTARPVAVERDASSNTDAGNGDALIELTAFGRANADEIVKEPPEAPLPVVPLPVAPMPMAQVIRRSSSDAVVAESASTDA
jgi:hypothetical protein